MKTEPSEWTETAWNGISFKAPDSWSLETIGKNHLFYSNGSEPVLELKWGPVRGSFSHKKQLKLLKSKQHSRSGKNIKSAPLPKGWKKALSAYDASCFTWQSRQTKAVGVIVHCPECKNAALIQFFGQNMDSLDPGLEKLLSSYRDHFPDNVTPWKMYDIKAMVPQSFTLKRYIFNAGQFEIEFFKKKARLVLYRWGPASIILNKTNLDEFAFSRFGRPYQKTEDFLIEAPTELEWLEKPDNFIFSGLIGLIKPEKVYKRFKIRHSDRNNRIFAVELAGKAALDTDFFQKLCDNYGSV